VRLLLLHIQATWRYSLWLCYSDSFTKNFLRHFINKTRAKSLSSVIFFNHQFRVPGNADGLFSCTVHKKRAAELTHVKITLFRFQRIALQWHYLICMKNTSKKRINASSFLLFRSSSFIVRDFSWMVLSSVRYTLLVVNKEEFLFEEVVITYEPQTQTYIKNLDWSALSGYEKT